MPITITRPLLEPGDLLSIDHFFPPRSSSDEKRFPERIVLADVMEDQGSLILSEAVVILPPTNRRIITLFRRGRETCEISERDYIARLRSRRKDLNPLYEIPIDSNPEYWEFHFTRQAVIDALTRTEGFQAYADYLRGFERGLRAA